MRVVLPNMLAAMIGRSAASAGGTARTMPTMAPAARVKIDARNAVDAGDVGDRGNQRDVFRADVRGDVAAGDGRDADFGHAGGKRSHRGGDDAGPAGAAHADDARRACLRR